MTCFININILWPLLKMIGVVSFLLFIPLSVEMGCQTCYITIELFLPYQNNVTIINGIFVLYSCYWILYNNDDSPWLHIWWDYSIHAWNRLFKGHDMMLQKNTPIYCLKITLTEMNFYPFWGTQTSFLSKVHCVQI